MLHIVIPMAGSGKRFKEAGFKLPKPLIDVCGKPMISLAIKYMPKGEYIFVVLKEQLNEGLKDFLVNKGKIVTVNKTTEGAASTALLVKKIINTDDELLLAVCDQYLEFDSVDFLKKARQSDGCLITFNSTNPHHSYAKLVKGKVVEVAEKVVISDHASAGVYYFKHGRDFVKGAEAMIKKNIRTGNEFYLGPVYNELIADGKNISIYEIDVSKKHMLGTPYELQIFVDKVNNDEVQL